MGFRATMEYVLTVAFFREHILLLTIISFKAESFKNSKNDS